MWVPYSPNKTYEAGEVRGAHGRVHVHAHVAHSVYAGNQSAAHKNVRSL